MSLLLLFRPRTGVAPPPPPPPPPQAEIPPVEGGGGGWANPKLSSLTKTRNLPFMRVILEKEDELIVETIMIAVVKDTLQ